MSKQTSQVGNSQPEPKKIFVHMSEVTEEWGKLQDEEEEKTGFKWGWETQPVSLPDGWTQEAVDINSYWVRHKSGLVCGISWNIELDHKRWLHVSFSHAKKLPSYEETTLVKRLFIGEGRKALAVFPPSSEHISTHDYCLHLWCCLDGDGLPDFRRGTNQI